MCKKQMPGKNAEMCKCPACLLVPIRRLQQWPTLDARRSPRIPKAFQNTVCLQPTGTHRITRHATALNLLQALKPSVEGGKVEKSIILR